MKINYYSYIHYHEINYEDDIKKYDVGKTYDAIRNKYIELRREAGARISAINNNLPNGVEVIDFVKQINQLSSQNGNSKILGNINSDAILNTFKLSTSSTNLAKVVENTKGAKNKAKILNSYLQEIDNIMNLVKTLDDNLAKYYEQQMDIKTQSNLNTLFGNIDSDKLSIININKSGVVAFNNLKNKIEALRRTALQSGGKKFVNRNIRYKHVDKNGKASIRSRKAVDELYEISNQIVSIQGSISEAINAICALEVADNIINNFVKESKKNSNLSVEFLSTDNQNIGSKAKDIIRVAYPKVNIDTRQINNIGYDVTTDIKIPIKTVNFNSTSKQNIRFLTTSLQNILSKVENYYQYFLLNGLAFNHYNKQSGYYPAINRYIAAQNFDTAATSFGLDNVVLLGFLDRIITIQELYNSILTGQNYPRVSISGITKVDLSAINPDALPSGKDENPMFKNIYAVQRSSRVFNDMMELQAKIMWKY